MTDNRYQLRTLGALDLSGPDGTRPEQVLAQSKRLALIVYLATAAPRGFQRKDAVIALFWPESPEWRARRALNRAVYFLRASLNRRLIVSRGDEDIAVAPGLLWCDAVEFEDELAAGRPEQALSLYRGEFVAGFHVDGLGEFDRWVEAERGRLSRRAVQTALELAQREEARGHLQMAAQWTERASTLSPHDELVVRRRLALLDRAGNRGGALDVYREFAAGLRRDLDVEPAPETRELVTAIRTRPTADEEREAPGPEGPSWEKPEQVEAIGTRAAAAPRSEPGGTTRLQRLLVYAGLVVALAGALVVARRGRDGRAPPSPAYPRTAVAVLPFETLGLDDTHRTFVDGLHAEVLTQLAKVGALTVRGRTSVMGYAGTARSVKEIARNLEVGTLLEANAQIIDRRLRLNVRLVHAVTDVQLWAERYDGTIDDAFAIQTDLAQRIVTAVGATLAGAERAAIVAPPTASAEAYTLYLQARGYWTRPGYDRRNWETAQDLYQRAVELDSGFALAHAALSELHGIMHWVRYDPSPARVARQRAEAEVALRLAPHLAEAHVAMGLAHYWGRRDYRGALKELRAASVGLPNDARLWEVIGFVERRLGNWDEVLAAFESAIRLDPRNADLYWNLGGITYRIMHRYADAVRVTDRALRLAPDLQNVAIRRGWLYVVWQGQLDTLRAALRRISADAPLAELGNRTAQHLLLLRWDRQADSLLQIVSVVPDSAFQGQEFFFPAWLFAGWAHTSRGDRAAARVAFDRALLLLDSAARTWPDDYRIHAARGLALAGLDRRGEALEEAHWLQRSVVYREDANAGPLVAEARAHILAQVGDADAAVEEIERLLARPSWLSVHALRLDPLWDPIRAHPRFGALLRRPAAGPAG